MKRSIIKRFSYALFASALAVLASLLACNALVLRALPEDHSPEGGSYQAALVFGARVYSDGRLSDMFRDRVDSALELYQAGLVPKILVSGDHGQAEYDEVNAAREYLLDKGVRAEDIFLDHAGFDTYDSLYRAQAVFGVKSAVLVTQAYHLPRAFFIARHLGLSVAGQDAARRHYVGEPARLRREYLARCKAVADVVFGAEPTYLGPFISIEGDGRSSW
jgi:SanA protein